MVRRALSAMGRLGGDVLVVGAAGAGRDPERSELRNSLRAETLADTVVVTTDIEIALEGAFERGPGMVVSAGTGSIAVGRDRQGNHRRIGGYGWLMGDEGSGYAIGRAALGAVSRAHDCRSPRTALTERLLATTRSNDFDALVRWAAGASPAEIAALAPAVLEVAAWEEQAGEPEFVARWSHRVGGIPVERDFIHVDVNGNHGKAFAVHRKWHALDFDGTPR